MSDIEGSMNDVARALERLPTREERLAEEEQRAWDMYFTSARERLLPRPEAAEEASKMLDERRKRFGAGKEADDDTVAMPRDLAMQCMTALGDSADHEVRQLLVRSLRAFVSE